MVSEDTIILIHRSVRRDSKRLLIKVVEITVITLIFLLTGKRKEGINKE